MRRLERKSNCFSHLHERAITLLAGFQWGTSGVWVGPDGNIVGLKAGALGYPSTGVLVRAAHDSRKNGITSHPSIAVVNLMEID